MIIDDELRHLDRGALDNERPGGIGLLTVEATCPTGARMVLARCQEVLSAVIRGMAHDVEDLADWRRRLPGWFVDACAVETPEQAEQWLAWWSSLPEDERAAAAEDRAWTLEGWLHWFTPGERQWYWWDATCVLPTLIQVRIEIAGSPTPTGALRWLLRAAGADAVDVPED